MRPDRLRFCIALLFGISHLATAAELFDQHPGYRSRPLQISASGKTGFTVISPVTSGITFSNQLSETRSIRNRNLVSGSGLAAGDVDGDGRVDLYFCNLDGANVLYRNLGNWRFEDITAEAGVACPDRDATGACFADVDGDGDLDLLVNSLNGGTQLFLNDGKGHFTESTAAGGLSSKRGSTSMALADIDGDGDLDLYVANYRPVTMLDSPGTQFRVEQENGKARVVSINGLPASLPDFTNRFEVGPKGDILEYGEPDDLYLNDGRGHFTRRPFTDGSFRDVDGKPVLQEDRGWGLAVQFHDLNGDGAPDIYVCNDLFTPDRIWMNDGRGGFREISFESIRNSSTFSMGVDVADINRDGFADLFVVDMLSRDREHRLVQVAGSAPSASAPGQFLKRVQVPRNVLQLNRGDGTFAEVAYWAGVEASGWSWGPIFLDVDLDGYEDLLISNGQLRDFQSIDVAARLEEAKAGKAFSFDRMLEVLRQFPGLYTPKVAFRNRRDGTFEEIGAEWGFNQTTLSQGMALADLDGDGDLDVIMNTLNGSATILRNETSAPRIAVRLRGLSPNTAGIGATIRVLGGPVTQSAEMICGGRYLSSDESLRVFAAGSHTNRLQIEVTWRSGKQTRVSDVAADSLCEIEEAGALEKRPATPLDSKAAVSMPWFSDRSGLLKHQHSEDDFDDFAHEPLLPHRLSQLGPGVSWLDVDADGWEDLVIPGGRGGTLAVFHNNAGRGFQRVSEPMLNRPAGRDQTAALGMGNAMIVGSSNYKDGTTNGGCARLYDFARKASGEILLGKSMNVGPVAMSDVDGDGVLELFVGGRSVPGRYPEPAPSVLFRNDGGHFVEVYRWDSLGMVSGAVFTDLEGDGLPELVLATEWGPVRVFTHLGEHPREITAELGLDAFKGWWNSVAAGDFDGDGRMDLVAGNWGMNTKHRVSPEQPLRLHYGDFKGDGGVACVVGSLDPLSGREMFERGLHIYGNILPFLRERASSYTVFAQASLPEMLGEELKQAMILEVNTLSSMVFLNRGGRLDARPLPAEAQWSPVFGLSVGDFDGDGHEDLFLAQNYSGNDLETPRSDAGRGLWLRGNGRGEFQSVPGQESGVAAYGDQRGSALADYDGDGRLDLVLTQNGSETKLYHNERARPGLRVHLKGPAGNPTGAGAVLRLQSKAGKGYAREVHMGGGYWSVDGATQVMTSVDTPEAITVRWPDGSFATAPVPAGTKELTLTWKPKETGR